MSDQANSDTPARPLDADAVQQRDNGIQTVVFWLAPCGVHRDRLTVSQIYSEMPQTRLCDGHDHQSGLGHAMGDKQKQFVFGHDANPFVNLNLLYHDFLFL